MFYISLIFHWMCFSDLTMEIVRYRLIGPQSHSVLAETLEAATDCDVRIMLGSFCLLSPNASHLTISDLTEKNYS